MDQSTAAQREFLEALDALLAQSGPANAEGDALRARVKAAIGNILAPGQAAAPSVEPAPAA